MNPARPERSVKMSDDRARMAEETYTHGHHESVLRSHEWRTAENSAGYLLDRLEPGHGPARRRLRSGHDHARPRGARRARARASGIDRADEVIAQAEALPRARRAPSNVAFATGDVYALDFDDASFDVVHAHQVLQHLQRPGRRVARAAPGAAPGRDARGARQRLRRVRVGAGRSACSTGGTSCTTRSPRATAPRRTPVATCSAGCRRRASRDVEAGSSTWTFADPERRAWWGSLWADRVEQSAFAEQARRVRAERPRRAGGDRGGVAALGRAARRVLRGAPRRGARPPLIRPRPGDPERRRTAKTL